MAKQTRTESIAADAQAKGMPLAAEYIRTPRAKHVLPTDALKTGNGKAKRATGGASYAVTQESFDIAFDAGRAYAGAYHAAAAALQPLLAPLSGAETDAAVGQWREYQRAFVLGMAEAREIDPDSARKAFNRLTEYLGLSKPQTAAAKAKQAQRAAKAPTKAQDGAEDAGEGVKAGAADAAVAAVQMGLSSIEAHLIALVRAGKFEMAAECIAAMADKAAE